MKKVADWDSSELSSICGSNPTFDAFSFTLFHGYYTSANLSQAAEPLKLVPFTSGGCGGFAGERAIQKMMFAAKSDTATVTGTLSGKGNVWTVAMEVDATTEYCRLTQAEVTQTQTRNGTETTSILMEPSTQCNSVPALHGYWAWPAGSAGCVLAVDGIPTDNSSPLHCNFHPFTAGYYTLVAEDVLGQTLFAYFQVT